MSTADPRWLALTARLDRMSDERFRTCFARLIELLERR